MTQQQAAQLEKIRRDGGVEVMMASAGSGKTFSLAREYIRLLLSDNEPLPHRHILAVTFTNKATDEMKSRIVEELDTLAHYTHLSAYRDFLLEQCGFKNEEKLREAAGNALEAILNDYSAFSVSTIDKFFQQTLRAFAREIGQISEYKVELDREALVDESVDILLDSLSEEKIELLKWLAESSIEKIEAGDGYHLDDNLRDFAQGYLTQEYEDKRNESGINEQDAFSKDNLRKLSTISHNIIADYDREFRKTLKQTDSYLRGLSGYEYISSTVKKVIAEGLEKSPAEFVFTSTVKNIAENGNRAMKAADRKYFTDTELEGIREHFAQLTAFDGKAYKDRRTAGILAKQIYAFRVAGELKEAFSELLREKNVLGIDDTNKILKEIIGNNEGDAPFIYEKTGTRYKHFLLDEFQDTSSIQWECFKPLLRNSIAEACYNLIVGDVKQSIYRWRDADWRILGEKVHSEVADPSQIADNPLDHNWRSADAIVEFNNEFYETLAEGRGIRENVYTSIRQKTNGKFNIPGCVDLSFIESDEIQDKVVETVRDAHERQFEYRDIAVIVRTNNQGQEVAGKLLSNGIPVITNDSLRISNAQSVKDTVLGLSFMDDPNDRINSFKAPMFDYQALTSCRSLMEIAGGLLRQLPKDQTDKDTLYILSFLDCVADYATNNGNSLHGFLKWWREKGMRKSISSPKESNAVTIITIHKCKGLDYPFVIIPLPAKDTPISGRDFSWEPLSDDFKELEDCENALYRIKIAKSSLAGTHFESCFDREWEMGVVDQANLWYVATTRASQEMHIISAMPTKNATINKFTHIKDALFCFAHGEHCVWGEPGDKETHKADPKKESKPKAVIGERALAFNHEGVSGASRGNIRISNEAAEFFLADKGNTQRRWGTVLHGILQNMTVPEDLDAAVKAALQDGMLNSEEAARATEILSRALESVEPMGWFRRSSGDIRSERDILCTGEGKNDNRPDRVVIFPDHVEIIDYKFGEQRKEHLRQVQKYMDLYRRMGYPDVRGYLWYVEDGRIEKVESTLL